MNKNLKVGVYAGSFNPFHKGHADILSQATCLFDKVIVAIGNNTEKNDEKEPFPDKFCEAVDHYTGLLSDYIYELQKNNPHDFIFLIRGLRNDKDLPYEQNLMRFVKEMYPPLRVVYFTCDPMYEHISSSALRALKKVSEREYKKYIVLPDVWFAPSNVERGSGNTHIDMMKL